LTEGASPARARPSGGALVFYDGIFVYRWAGKEGWVYLKGSSILDRRSLLRRRPAAAGLPASKDSGSRGQLESRDMTNRPPGSAAEGLAEVVEQLRGRRA